MEKQGSKFAGESLKVVVVDINQIRRCLASLLKQAMENNQETDGALDRTLRHLDALYSLTASLAALSVSRVDGSGEHVLLSTANAMRLVELMAGLNAFFGFGLTVENRKANARCSLSSGRLTDWADENARKALEEARRAFATVADCVEFWMQRQSKEKEAAALNASDAVGVRLPANIEATVRALGVYAFYTLQAFCGVLDQLHDQLQSAFHEGCQNTAQETVDIILTTENRPIAQADTAQIHLMENVRNGLRAAQRVLQTVNGALSSRHKCVAHFMLPLAHLAYYVSESSVPPKLRLELVADTASELIGALDEQDYLEVPMKTEDDSAEVLTKEYLKTALEHLLRTTYLSDWRWVKSAGSSDLQ